MAYGFLGNKGNHFAPSVVGQGEISFSLPLYETNHLGKRNEEKRLNFAL